MINKATVKAHLKLLLDGYPKAFLFTYRYLLGYAWRPTLTRFVGPKTELVLEGFQRSANTYALRLFEAAQTRSVSIAHHAHAASQIKEGLRRGIPCVLLIREPVDAVSSYLRVWPALQARTVLRLYASFYERLLPFKDELIVAGFDRVTHDFAAVIQELNTRCGTDFNLPDSSGGPTPQRIREQLTVGRSSFYEAENQEQERQKIRMQIEAPQCAPQLELAREIYQKFTAP